MPREKEDLTSTGTFRWVCPGEGGRGVWKSQPSSRVLRCLKLVWSPSQNRQEKPRRNRGLRDRPKEVEKMDHHHFMWFMRAG